MFDVSLTLFSCVLYANDSQCETLQYLYDMNVSKICLKYKTDC